VSADGLYYLPEGFREGARANESTAEAAENTRNQLGRVRIDAAAYGGADAFVAALTATRDAQARSVGRAAEGRRNMAAADTTVAGIGEETDTAAGQALGGASAAIPADPSVADGV
jgi:hypothetical protein